MDISLQTKELIERVRDKSSSTTMVEVIRKSVAIYDKLLDYKKVVVTDKNGLEHHLLIL